MGQLRSGLIEYRSLPKRELCLKQLKTFQYTRRPNRLYGTLGRHLLRQLPVLIFPTSFFPLFITLTDYHSSNE
jgi:hypothetical protein